MKWNHRVYNIKEKNKGEDLFVIRETYYDEDQKIMGSCDLAVMSETIDGLKWIAEQILKSVEQPVLTPEKDVHPNDIVRETAEFLNHSDLKIGCDLSDIGNQIGLAIGKHVDKNRLGFELESFIAGVRHGVSIVDGTH